MLARELLDLESSRSVAHEQEVDARVVPQHPHRLTDRVKVVDDAGITRVHHHELLAQSELIQQRILIPWDRRDLVLRTPYRDRVSPLDRHSLRHDTALHVRSEVDHEISVAITSCVRPLEQFRKQTPVAKHPGRDLSIGVQIHRPHTVVLTAERACNRSEKAEQRRCREKHHPVTTPAKQKHA